MPPVESHYRIPQLQPLYLLIVLLFTLFVFVFFLLLFFFFFLFFFFVCEWFNSLVVCVVDQSKTIRELFFVILVTNGLIVIAMGLKQLIICVAPQEKGVCSKVAVQIPVQIPVFLRYSCGTCCGKNVPEVAVHFYQKLRYIFTGSCGTFLPEVAVRNTRLKIAGHYH